MTSVRAFILTRTAYDVNNTCVLKYYCTSERGPLTLTVKPHNPLFFVERGASIPQLKDMTRKPVELQTFHEQDVDALYFNSLRSYYEGRDLLRKQSIRLFESDIRPADRYLMERFINNSVEISLSDSGNISGNEILNPRLTPSDYLPEFKWLSLDIETSPVNDKEESRLFSIAMHGVYGNEEIKKVLMLDSELNEPISGEINGIGNSILIYFPDEESILREFVKELQQWDPDILIGWHVVGFDLKFIQDKCRDHNIPLQIGRGELEPVIRESGSGLYSADIQGRVVIDGPQTFRSSFYKFDDYKLETVASEILGKGKDITPEEDKLAEILHRFNHDKQSLAKYNLTDCILVTDIYRKTGIIDQQKIRSFITGLPVDRVNMSVAAFDHLMLPAVHRKGLAAYDTRDIMPGKHTAGGLVFTSEPGLYKNIAVLDFKSLYPTIIRTFFIDPISLKRNKINPVITPSGHTFSRTEHVLPGFLEQMMAKREEAKKDNNPYLSQAIKIIMNSFYGVMGTTGCRFYHPDLPSAITETGQWLLIQSSAMLREKGYRVIYGDTDSLFVELLPEEAMNPEESSELLADRINSYLRDELLDKFKVTSRLEMEFEKYYPKFFLPAMRSTGSGARKRYAGQLPDGSIEFKGLEAVRSDWTELARQFQKELFQRFFSGLDIRDWLKDFVQDTREGRYNSLLVYKRKLNRLQSEYVKSTPPHIKAARLADPDGKRNLREVSYFITLRGPIPAEFNPEDLDYSHYIEKQIKPLADGVLFAVNESFDSIIEGKQLELF